MRWTDGNTKRPEVRAEDRETRVMSQALRRLLQAHTSVEPFSKLRKPTLVSERAGFCTAPLREEQVCAFPVLLPNLVSAQGAPRSSSHKDRPSSACFTCVIWLPCPDTSAGVSRSVAACTCFDESITAVHALNNGCNGISCARYMARASS